MSGKQLIKVDGDITKTVDRILGAANPAAKAAIDKYIRPIYARAVKEWPEKSGFSKRQLKLTVEVTGTGQVRVSIKNTAPYAYYIKQAGTDTRIVKRLIFDPAEEAKQRIVDEFGEQLARAAGRR